MATEENGSMKLSLPNSATVITALLTLVLSGVVKVASNFYTDYMALSQKLTNLQLQMAQGYVTKEEMKELSAKVDKVNDNILSIKAQNATKR